MKFSNLPRLYNNSFLIQDKILTLDSTFIHYLRNVLKIKLHSKCRVFNQNNGEFLSEVMEIDRNKVVLFLHELLREPYTEKSLIACISLIKTDKMLDAINMAVQIGATAIAPIIAHRSQIRVINREKFTKCIIEATEQCERLTPPILHDPVLLSDYLKNIACNDHLIIYANENEDEVSSIKNLELSVNTISFITGPEGGFTNQELEILYSWKNTKSISLGQNILRSETAVACGLSQICLIRN